MYNFDNYSHEYKTRRILDLDTILLFSMKTHLKNRNPALNVLRRHAPVATDAIFSDTPAVDNDVTQQITMFQFKEKAYP